MLVSVYTVTVIMAAYLFSNPSRSVRPTYWLESNKPGEGYASLGRFFAAGVALVSPELGCGRLEFHSKLEKSGGFFASRPNDATPNAKPRFFTVHGEHGALRPIHGS